MNVQRIQRANGGQAVATDPEHAEILAVIRAETACYFRKDHEGWAACWVHSPQAVRCVSFPDGGVFRLFGWDDIAQEMRRSMIKSPDPNASAGAVALEDIRIEVGQDMAWVTNMQTAPVTGDSFDVPGSEFQMRVLRRIAGAWKILSVACMCARSQDVANPWIEIDERLRVLSMTEAAELALANQSVLKISGGRLHAGIARETQKLRDAAERAAQRRNARSTHAIQGFNASFGFSEPVVLESEDALSICWIVVDDRKFFLTLGEGERVDRRLAAARQIYGLSTAQARLAALLLQQHDLNAAAEVLGVTVNTARTHLKRMFEKTGTNSQVALISALLKVDPPLA